MYNLILKKNIKNDVILFHNKSQNSNLVYIRMKHAGKKGYYESIKQVVDSFRKKNYIICYEGIDFDKDLDNNEKEIYQKKMRKMIGYDISLTKKNKSLPSYFKNFELQNDHNFGLDKNIDINLDLSLKQLIDSTENKYGKIQLSECDLKTPLMQEYKCKNDRYYDFLIANYFRDPFIIKEIEKMKNKNIVLLYGKQHYFMQRGPINALGYEIVK